MKNVLIPISSEIVSPKRLLKIYSQEADNIRDVQFEIPKIGSGSFGSFRVYYKMPILRSKRCLTGI